MIKLSQQKSILTVMHFGALIDETRSGNVPSRILNNCWKNLRLQADIVKKHVKMFEECLNFCEAITKLIEYVDSMKLQVLFVLL